MKSNRTIVVGIYDATTDILLKEYLHTGFYRSTVGAIRDAEKKAQNLAKQDRIAKLESKYGITAIQLRLLASDGEIDLLKHYVFKILHRSER